MHWNHLIISTYLDEVKGRTRRTSNPASGPSPTLHAVCPWGHELTLGPDPLRTYRFVFFAAEGTGAAAAQRELVQVPEAQTEGLPQPDPMGMPAGGGAPQSLAVVSQTSARTVSWYSILDRGRWYALDTHCCSG
jgi:hypothetical protein